MNPTSLLGTCEKMKPLHTFCAGNSNSIIKTSLNHTTCLVMMSFFQKDFHLHGLNRRLFIFRTANGLLAWAFNVRSSRYLTSAFANRLAEAKDQCGETEKVSEKDKSVMSNTSKGEVFSVQHFFPPPALCGLHAPRARTGTHTCWLISHLACRTTSNGAVQSLFIILCRRSYLWLPHRY